MKYYHYFLKSAIIIDIKLSLPIYFIFSLPLRWSCGGLISAFTIYPFMLLLVIGKWGRPLVQNNSLFIYPPPSPATCTWSPCSPHSKFCLTTSKWIQKLGNSFGHCQAEIELPSRPGIWCISQDHQASKSQPSSHPHPHDVIPGTGFCVGSC